MISDFETGCLHQKFDCTDDQSNLDVLAPCASKSSEFFLVRIDFREKEFNEVEGIDNTPVKIRHLSIGITAMTVIKLIITDSLNLVHTKNSVNLIHTKDIV
jgi:hypothetical protein